MKEFSISGVHCMECAHQLEEKLNQAQSDKAVTIDYSHHLLSVSEHADMEKVQSVLDFEKVRIKPIDEVEAHEHEGEGHNHHDHAHHHAPDVDFNSNDHAIKNIKIVFFLNAIFAIIEFIFGGLFNSTAILTDAVHDTGDALSVGLAWFFQKISTKEANEKYTFGHQRFSLLGALITSVVLLGGSIVLLFHVLPELFNPEPVHYRGMFWLAIFAICSKLFCMWLMSRGTSKNESLLNLHMLEDLLGWCGVLLVSILVRYTSWYILDPLLSVAIASFIIYKTWPLFVETVEIFLNATPKEVNHEEIEEKIRNISGVQALSHLHVWSIDGEENALTVTVSLNSEYAQLQEEIKRAIRKVVEPYQMTHTTIEIVVDKENILSDSWC